MCQRKIICGYQRWLTNAYEKRIRILVKIFSFYKKMELHDTTAPRKGGKFPACWLFYLWFERCFCVSTHQQLHRRRAAELMLTVPYANRDQGKPVITQRIYGEIARFHLCIKRLLGRLKQYFQGRLAYPSLFFAAKKSCLQKQVCYQLLKIHFQGQVTPHLPLETDFQRRSTPQPPLKMGRLGGGPPFGFHGGEGVTRPWK